jgi:hypothetical protein
LNSLLLSESISIESDNALLQIILKLGPAYRHLLKHIQIGFLCYNGFSILGEDFGIPPESLWRSATERIVHPPLPPFPDSQIFSKFPQIFAELWGKRFDIQWRVSGGSVTMVFGSKECHRRCDGKPIRL